MPKILSLYTPPNVVLEKFECLDNFGRGCKAKMVVYTEDIYKDPNRWGEGEHLFVCPNCNKEHDFEYLKPGVRPNMEALRNYNIPKKKKG